jgi:hypothetical protein
MLRCLCKKRARHCQAFGCLWLAVGSKSSQNLYTMFVCMHIQALVCTAVVTACGATCAALIVRRSCRQRSRRRVWDLLHAEHFIDVLGCGYGRACCDTLLAAVLLRQAVLAGSGLQAGTVVV